MVEILAGQAITFGSVRTRWGGPCRLAVDIRPCKPYVGLRDQPGPNVAGLSLLLSKPSEGRRTKMTRRKLFHAAVGSSLAHALLAGGQQTSGRRLTPADSLPEADKNRKLKVVFIGAHVDDWCGCAGTLARYSQQGHAVVCYSFTPGDSQSMADAHHMSLDALSKLRREDAVRGAKII